MLFNLAFAFHLLLLGLLCHRYAEHVRHTLCPDGKCKTAIVSMVVAVVTHPLVTHAALEAIHVQLGV